MAVNYFQDRCKLIKEYLRPGRGQERKERQEGKKRGQQTGRNMQAGRKRKCKRGRNMQKGGKQDSRQGGICRQDE
jgi:hypothetical protein